MIEVDTEIESSGSEQKLSRPSEAAYMDGLELFKEYIEARRLGNASVYLAIENLVLTPPTEGGPYPSATYLLVSKDLEQSFKEAIASTRREAAAARFRDAMNNPEGVDPRELGRILRDFMRLCGGDTEAAGEALHAGY